MRERSRPELLHLVVEQRRGDGHLTVRTVCANRKRKHVGYGNEAAQQDPGRDRDFDQRESAICTQESLGEKGRGS